MLNLNEYWKTILGNTILDNRLKFYPTPENFKKLIGLFEKGRNDIELAKIIDALLLQQKHHRISKYSKQTKINKTLRMTCIE